MRWSAIWLLLAPSAALAGMPFVTLTDLAKLRLDTLSFFLAAFFTSAKLLQALWNYLQADFPRLPRLSYRRSLAMTLLWGLLFSLVLTMIAGARELLTPGAWDRLGSTYHLSAPPTPLEALDHARRRRLEDLRRELWAYAAAHQEQLPPHDRVASIRPDVWETLHPDRARFVYLGGHLGGEGVSLIAIEPDVYGGDRLVLRSDGTIRSETSDRIAAALLELAR